MESSKALPCGLRPTSLTVFLRFVHVSKWSFSVSTWGGRIIGPTSTYHPTSHPQECVCLPRLLVFFFFLLSIVPTPRRTLTSATPTLERTCKPSGTRSTFPTFSLKFILLASSLSITLEESRELIRGLPNCKRREFLAHTQKHKILFIYLLTPLFSFMPHTIPEESQEMGMIASYNAGGGYDNEYEQDKPEPQNDTKREIAFSSGKLSGSEDYDSGEDIYSSIRSPGGTAYSRVQQEHGRGESGFEPWPQARPTGQGIAMSRD